MLTVKEKTIYKTDKNNIEIFITTDNQLWFSIANIAKLFNRDHSVIRRRIKELQKAGIFKEEDLRAKFAHNLPISQSNRPALFYNFEFVKLLAQNFDLSGVSALENYLLSYDKSRIHYTIEPTNNNQIIIYDNGSITLDVTISPQEETVWLTAKQISKLFGTTIRNIRIHISNIFKDKELDNSVRKDFLHTASDGKQYLVTFYNLDMILSLGYRVKSQIAINFRRWASKVLSELMLKGYVKDDERCKICQTQILEIKNDILQLKYEKPREIVYYNGDILRGFIEIKRFLETATKEIIIIDNYFDNSFDDVLAMLNVKKIIITNKKNQKIEQSSFYKVYKCNDFHGRYIIVDDICYHSDQSLKDIGKHEDLINKVTEPLFIKFLKNVVQQIINKEE